MWVRAAAGLAIAAMAFASGWSVQGWRKDAGFAAERSAWAREQNRALAAALDAKRQQEERAERARKEYERAKQEIAARDADNRHLLAELRRLDAFAAGGDDDTRADAVERALALSRLAQEGAGLVAEGESIIRELEADIERLTTRP